MSETQNHKSSFAPRTDLACEANRAGVESRSRTVPVGSAPVTVTRSRESSGGRYVTLFCGSLTEREEDLELLARLLADEISALASVMLGHAVNPSLRVLVAGLGNDRITPDAIGPGTTARLSVTRHLKTCRSELYRALGCCELSALTPGVLGRTGVEAADLVRQTAVGIRAQLVVAVDAVAARSCQRLASTIQLSDCGISPGAGIGNTRTAINRETIGCPVLALGVPTVVDSATLVLDALEQAGLSGDAVDPAIRHVLESGRSFIVSPTDSDRVVELTCRLLARALDMAFGIEREGEPDGDRRPVPPVQNTPDSAK